MHVVSYVSELSKFDFKKISCGEHREVPSGFYITDAFLWLDGLLGRGLLVPDKDNTKQTMAASDSKRLKKLMGALRYLFRNSHLLFITSFSNVFFLKGG